MNNFSDGKTDGLALVYVKDDVIYPVAINKEELELLDIMIPSIIKKIRPITDCSMGKAKILNK